MLVPTSVIEVFDVFIFQRPNLTLTIVLLKI